MKLRLGIIMMLFYFTSCSSDEKKIETQDAESVIEIDSGTTDAQSTISQSGDSLIDLFKLSSAKSLKLSAKNDTYSSYKEDDEIPYNYQNLFDGHLYPMSRSTTGYIPKSYFNINDSISFLIIFIQDDYGPVYHGLEYNKRTRSISSSQILAREWRDAGDSQTIYSELEIENYSLTISKFITTCHAELNFESDPVEVISEECSDSTFLARIK